MQKTRLNKTIILSALLVALAVAIGYLFVFVPNVEMITATVFVAGMVVGPLFGMLVGAIAELIFSLLNPVGAAAAPLLVAQVISFALVGLAGGLVGMPGKKSPWLYAALYGGCGFFLTLIFDVLTTLSFALFNAGGDIKKILAFFGSGLPFYLMHIIVNTIIFVTIVPLLAYGIQRYQTTKSHA